MFLGETFQQPTPAGSEVAATKDQTHTEHEAAARAMN
jgi:hypothetical protein